MIITSLGCDTTDLSLAMLHKRKKDDWDKCLMWWSKVMNWSNETLIKEKVVNHSNLSQFVSVWMTHTAGYHVIRDTFEFAYNVAQRQQYKANENGPRTEPWGTPQKTVSNIYEPNDTKKLLSERYEENQSTYCFSLSLRIRDEKFAKKKIELWSFSPILQTRFIVQLLSDSLSYVVLLSMPILKGMFCFFILILNKKKNIVFEVQKLDFCQWINNNSKIFHKKNSVCIYGYI